MGISGEDGLTNKTPVYSATWAIYTYCNITTDQKVGGSSPSKRTETQEAFTTSWASSFLGATAFACDYC